MANCQSVDNMAICMPVSWICNRHPSCTNNDKKICTAPLEEEKCTSDQFWCHLEEDPEKQCLALSKKCNNVTDCFGGEDEAYCFGKYAKLHFFLIHKTYLKTKEILYYFGMENKLEKSSKMGQPMPLK